MAEETHIIHHQEPSKEHKVNYIPLISVAVTLLTGGIAVYTNMQNTISTLELRIVYLEKSIADVNEKLNVVRAKIIRQDTDINELSNTISINELTTQRRLSTLEKRKGSAAN